MTTEQTELTVGFDKGSPEGDYSALTINYKGKLYQFIGDEADAILALINKEVAERVAEAELKAEIRVHDEYWHSQRLVDEHGIGPIALANKEAAELQLAQLSPKEPKADDDLISGFFVWWYNRSNKIDK